MALLQFGPVQFDASLVILDKDGTLVDFDHMWGRFALEWIAEVIGQLGLPDQESTILETLGIDVTSQKTRPGTPLVSGSAEQLQTIVATLLMQAGTPWSDSVETARSAFELVTLRSPPHHRIRSFGDVRRLLAGLQSAGVKVAVATTDDRDPTTHILSQLGISEQVDTMVCGDDGVAWKPSPDMLLAACASLGVPAGRSVVIGDTDSDMMMAEAGGAGFKVAVLSGVGEEQILRQTADVVLSSIADVAVVDTAVMRQANAAKRPSNV